MILVDARKGILTQTRRHGYIAYLFGIRDVVLKVEDGQIRFAKRAIGNRVGDDTPQGPGV